MAMAHRPGCSWRRNLSHFYLDRVARSIAIPAECRRTTLAVGKEADARPLHRRRPPILRRWYVESRRHDPCRHFGGGCLFGRHLGLGLDVAISSRRQDPITLIGTLRRGGRWLVSEHSVD